ncbi:MAG: hypothetical protein F7C32_00735 [Desulfurococcales archaeon]|nr:hypothetical protein [Desulfurococcales archaeon]
MALKVYSKGAHRGDIQYETVPVGIEFPRDTGGRHVINVGIKRHRVKGARTGKVLLGIKVSSNEPINRGFRWKISVNGIVVSRIFKPFEIASLGGRWFGYEIYDATPVVSGKLRNKIQKIGILYPGGYDIIIEDVDFLVNIETDETMARGYHDFRSGIQIVKPGEVFEFDKPTNLLSRNNAELVSYERFLLFLPNRQARFVISSGDIERTVTGRSGFVDLVINRDSNNGSTRIAFDSPSGVYPREGAILSYFWLWQEYVGPKLVIEKAIYSFEENGKVELLVSNVGERTPENLQVILINAGTLVKRINVKPLKPKEKQDIRVKNVKLVDEDSPLVVRVLWNWLSRNEFIEAIVSRY